MFTPPDNIVQQVSAALQEDVATGDLTAALIPASQQAKATIITREHAVICGKAWADECFKQVDPTIQIKWQVDEGQLATPNQVLCVITGLARPILTGERCALNFLQTLSAVATATRQLVDLVAGTRARILDTRKTIPLLRLAEKYAVTVGGGDNQRIGLYDGILIKENHIMAAGGILPALQAAQTLAGSHTQTKLDNNTPSGKAITIQIEVETIAQLQEALACGATLILLDNFNLEQLREAVRINAGRAVLEASGGISAETVQAIAQTGVDRISVGSVTKNVKAVDLSLRFQAL